MVTLKMHPVSLALILMMISGAWGTPSHAEPTQNSTNSVLTLDGAIDEAMKNSPVIQQGEAVYNQSSWAQFQALGQGFLPKISAGFSHYLSQTYQETAISFNGGPFLAFPGAFPTNILTVNASMPIFNGLSNIYNLQAASLEKSAAQQDYERTKFETAQEVKLAFYQALAASRLNEVALQNVKTLEDHLKQVEVQKQGGVATNYDTLRVSVQLSEGKSDLIDAEDNAVLARKKLNTLLGIEADDRALQGVLPVPEPSKAQSVEFTGVPKDRTDLDALELRARAADKTRSAQNSWFIPAVSILGQYNYYEVMNENTGDGSVVASGSYKPAYSVAVALTWNIFDGGVALAQSRQAKYQQVQADKKSEQARLQVPYDLTYWKKRFLSNTDRYLTRKLDVERSEESVRLAKLEEKAGTRTSTETLDAELDLFRSRAGVVNAQVNALEAQIRLELALGRTL